VKSNPPGANVVMKGTGISKVTDTKIDIPHSLFEEGSREGIIYDKTEKEYIICLLNSNNRCEVEGVERNFGNKVVSKTFYRKPSDKKRYEILIFEKDGYRSQEKLVLLNKGESQHIVAELNEVDTSLNIISTPAPVHLYFLNDQVKSINDPDYEDKIKQYLPKGWPTEFTTPINFTCTEKEAKELRDKKYRLKKDNNDGFLPTGQYRDLSFDGHKLKLDPGKQNELNVSLKPVVTTLQVITSPPGAIVEDISSGGFGYLGETPLIRNFNWEDVVEWSEKRQYKKDAEEAKARLGANRDPDSPVFDRTKNRRIRLEDSLLYLDLRITKAGYEESYIKRLRLPIGEERSFHKNLNEEISLVNFASDPAGVHVYVVRHKEKDIYDEKTGKVENMEITYKKHLGTTPFTLNIDPTDPLKHGDEFFFMKPGYITVDNLKYAYGNANYYVVMEPVNIKKR
jgi:hypothetical protein